MGDGVALGVGERRAAECVVAACGRCIALCAVGAPAAGWVPPTALGDAGDGLDSNKTMPPTIASTAAPAMMAANERRLANKAGQPDQSARRRPCCVVR